MIGPEELEHIQQFVEAFQAVEGGVRSWNEFQQTAKGSFAGDNQDKTPVGWQVHKEANQSNDISVIGRKPDAAGWANKEGYQTPSIEDWAFPVNDAWIQGGIDRGAKFRVASPIEDNLWDEFENRPTVFARSLEQLRLAGYTLSDNGEFMLPPR
jgi:hypothetical protein